MLLRTLLTASLFSASLIPFNLSAETTVSSSSDEVRSQEEAIFDSVLRIEVSTLNPDYRTPWNTGGLGGGNGTGFLIGPNQILTNAHVVSNARRILVTRRNSASKLAATISFIAHDCDLALLTLDDPSAISDLTPLEIGGMPALDSEVRAIGYPVGGDRLSVTRGIVSRIDFRPYSHSRADSHLVIQVDAAINPGNSGGPAIQGGKIIGVAFQGLTQADNTGYIIPTPVIRRFLTDIEDGTYDQYVDLGATTFPLFNPTMRKALGLKDDGRGVLVTSILPEGPCDGLLEVDDILLTIDGKEIDSAGNINVDGETLVLHEIVERKFAGDTIILDIIRNGSKETVSATLKPLPGSNIRSIVYDKRPEYLIYGGLVFQPLTLNAQSAHRLTDVTTRKLTADYLSEGIFEEKPQIIFLTRIENDELTSTLPRVKGRILNSVNGESVRDMKHLKQLLYESSQPEFTAFELEATHRPLVLPSDEVEAATQRIMARNSITNPFFIQD